MRRSSVVLFLLLVLGSAFAGASAPAAAPAAGPAADDGLDSPYVAVLYPQLPNVSRPWQNDPASNAKLFSRARAAGLRWTYVWVAWSDIEKSEGSYSEAELAKLDTYLALAREHEMNIVLQLMVGAWSNPQPWNPPTRRNSRKPPPNVVPGQPLDTSGPLAAPPLDLAGPRDFARMLVERYRPGGQLAQERGWATYGVRVWELENEPDSLPWWGDWSKVPKDYAEYLSVVVPAMKAADPEAVIKAPALSHRDGERLSGLPWLEEVLTPGDAESDWASDQYRASGGAPGGGPFIDAFSFHRNNPTLHDKQAAQRAVDVRALADRFTTHPQSPTQADAELHFSEGGALQYQGDAAEFSWAQAQLMTQMHGVGVDKMVLSLGAEINKDPWPEVPLYKAVQALTTHLPRSHEVVPADDAVDPERVTTYLRTDPDSGLRTYVLWAHDLPPGAENGEPFTVDVPVSTSAADVVGWDWGTTRTPAAGGVVQVTLRPGDPSPVVIVAERSTTTRGGSRASKGWWTTRPHSSRTRR